MRVLIIKTSSLGDLIHTLPALSDAADQGDFRFDWVTEEAFVEVPRWHPNVDHVIPVALRRWRKAPLQAWRSGEWRTLKKNLGQRRYQRVIDAQGLLKSAWLTRYTTGARYGLDKNSAREPLASRFYQHPVAITKNQHAVERVRQLFAAALDYPPPTRPADYRIDRAALEDNPYTGRSYLVFLHGTTWPSKHWPEPHWRQLAALAAAAGLQVLIPWGNTAEQQRAERIAADNDCINVMPRLNLGTLAAILADAEAVISVDTGLAHLCAALNTPNITLYGPTQPKLVGTYGANQIHLRAADCGNKTSASAVQDPLAGITATQVFTTLKTVVKQAKI